MPKKVGRNGQRVQGQDRKRPQKPVHPHHGEGDQTVAQVSEADGVGDHRVVFGEELRAAVRGRLEEGGEGKRRPHEDEEEG